MRHATLCSICLAITIPAVAAPTIDAHVEHYPIKPNSIAHLPIALANATPLRQANGYFLGRTDWRVTWRYRHRQHLDRCWTFKSNVKAKITYILPTLAKGHPTPIDAEKLFLRYYNRLLQHEEQHGLHGKTAARKIDQLLTDLSAPDCEQLDQLIQRKTKAIIQYYNQQDKMYDKRTHHGKTEGVDLKYLQQKP